MKSNHKNQPTAWQLNPTNVETERVQFWRNGIMLTAQMSNADAREKVVKGLAYVISGQSIGALSDGRRNG